MKLLLMPIMLIASLATAYAQYPCTVTSSGERSINEEEFNAYVGKFIDASLQHNTDILCVPVVFHIINEPGFPGQRVHDQLTRTNQHLRRTHADTVNTRELFVPHATDSHIQLKLASLLPDGTPFNGIVHIEVPGYTLGMTQAVVEANMLDHTRYLNVWVFPGISASGVFPWQAEPTHDGIKVAPENVGYLLGGDDPAIQGGKVFTHEIGHFLGLYHPFHGDGWMDPGNCTDPGCFTTGDRCCDTPYDYRLFPITGDVCTMDTLYCEFGGPLIPNDENFMFYNLDHCQNMFTHDQRIRMRASLFNSNARASLTTAETHALTGIACESNVGLAEVTSDRQMDPYPNPVQDLLYLDRAGGSLVDLVLIDHSGRIMWQRQNWLTGRAIDLSGLAAGIYHLRITGNTRSIGYKVVKQ